MLQYEFESVNCLAHSYNIFGGFGPEREKLREAIARRAAEGWRYAGFVPTKQHGNGYLLEIDLVFERETDREMEQKKIERINELSRIARQRELTDEEKVERAALRQEYVNSVLGDLKNQLNNTYVMDEKGNKTKLTKWSEDRKLKE